MFTSRSPQAFDWIANRLFALAGLLRSAQIPACYNGFGAKKMRREIEDLLQQFRNEVGLALGSNLEQVIVYGSRARGDEEPDSDLDVLVVLRDSGRSERETIHRIAYQLMWDREFQPLISLNIIDREHYLFLMEAGSSYLANILREGKPLWPISETKANIG